MHFTKLSKRPPAYCLHYISNKPLFKGQIKQKFGSSSSDFMKENVSCFLYIAYSNKDITFSFQSFFFGDGGTLHCRFLMQFFLRGRHFWRREYRPQLRRSRSEPSAWGRMWRFKNGDRSDRNANLINLVITAWPPRMAWHNRMQPSVPSRHRLRGRNNSSGCFHIHFSKRAERCQAIRLRDRLQRVTVKPQSLTSRVPSLFTCSSDLAKTANMC